MANQFNEVSAVGCTFSLGFRSLLVRFLGPANMLSLREWRRVVS